MIRALLAMLSLALFALAFAWPVVPPLKPGPLGPVPPGPACACGDRCPCHDRCACGEGS